ncbi:Glyoxalase/bleomycin resistance protein/dioxygenase [hydrothermal vent metagenome]|uniref:Glyoxalase/bleomycin resistance protein/dioxygenase n=1 Tax=hydrothermal vent metagenome TaxID=652676 RepID=A0A3B1B4F7_9ZZZZ
MSTDAMKQHGAFSWNELMTTDIEGAKAFYGELLGWSMGGIECGDMNYTMVKSGETEVAGLMGIPPEAAGMPPAWGAYVTVDDVDAMVTRVEKLGGKICVPPRDIPNVGRFVVIQDPQGAVLSLITYSNTE